MSVNQDRSTLMMYRKLCGLFVQASFFAGEVYGIGAFPNSLTYPSILKINFVHLMRGLAQIFPQSSFLLDVNSSPREIIGRPFRPK